MATKLNAQQIAIGYGVASLASITTGLVGGYLWGHLGGHTDYVLAVGGTWLLTVGLPSVAASAESLRRVLGRQAAPSIHASNRAGGRTIPLTVDGRTTSLFLSSLLWFNQTHRSQDELSPLLPEQFTVTVEGVPYTLSLPQIEAFLYHAWRRQRARQPGLSRAYWTVERRPDRLSRHLYDALMTLLCSVDGLVLDRGERRSGRLAVPPQLSLQAIQGTFSLG